MLNDTNIVISVTCYNNEDEVIAFAKQIAKQSVRKNIRLIITCNSTNRYQYLQDNINRIPIVTNIYNTKKNLGYLPGCLYGVKQTKLIENYWLMISNTDLSFPSDSFFEELLQNVEPDVWCIGPNIILKETGKSQNPFFLNRPSHRSMLIRKVIYSNYLLYKIYFKLSDLKSKAIKKQKCYSSQYVYAVHGSCFILNSDIVPMLIDECKNIFMYGEEILISELVKEQMKKIFYNSNVTVIHNENQVTGTIATKIKQQWFKQSTNYIFRRFFD